MHKHCAFKPVTLESITEEYSGVKKARYEKARKDIIERNCLANPDRINTTRKSFIKSEPLYKVKPNTTLDVALGLFKELVMKQH